MTGLESDLKRLIQNAKDFNATSSKIYEDAERIRKALSNFMPKHNPAYNDKDYRAAPTPLPQDGSSDEASQQNTADVLAKTAPEPSASFDLKGPADGLARQDDDQNMENSTSSPEVSMREEQLKIVGELIELRDPELVLFSHNKCKKRQRFELSGRTVILRPRSPLNSMKSLLDDPIPTIIGK